MKTTFPLILGVVVGFIAWGELYIDEPHYREVFEHFRDFAQVLASMAFILGAINLFQVHGPKIRRREEDWQYKVVMFAGALVMGVAGISWHAMPWSDERPPGYFEKSGVIAGADRGRIVFDTAHREALVQIDGGEYMRAWHSGDPREDRWRSPGEQALQVDLEPGPHRIAVIFPQTGYSKYQQDLELKAGEIQTVHTSLQMYWGARSPEEGRVFNWLYDHIFFPCNATMFALLAFFIASAAFRAFRMRNVESGLLLGAAILVMLGLVPIGRAISPIFPEIQEWIVDIPNNAGRRAIMMGAALGAIVTGLRVILGLERSHLGGEQ
jgi:hypothetical protein